MTNTRPGDSAWERRMRDEAAAADAAHTPNFTYAPHDGQTSDANLLGADLLAGPDLTHPDVAADTR